MYANEHTIENGNAQSSGGTPEGRNGNRSVPATTGRGAPTTPEWQKISGIDPKRESEMDADARDAALRKLIDEVTKRATHEFERADSGKIPEGERTIFWDPLQRVCLQLGISRTKLSAYSRELTGLRAHEISDRIQAERYLEERLLGWIEEVAAPRLAFMRSHLKPSDAYAGKHVEQETKLLMQQLKGLRKDERRGGFAAAMGFANFSRLNRACLLAHGVTFDHFEYALVCTYVQKFFEDLLKEQMSELPKRQDAKEQPKKEEILTDEEKIAGDRIVKEVLDEFLGLGKRQFQVA